jgi:hypothetical protein
LPGDLNDTEAELNHGRSVDHVIEGAKRVQKESMIVQYVADDTHSFPPLQDFSEMPRSVSATQHLVVLHFLIELKTLRSCDVLDSEQNALLEALKLTMKAWHSLSEASSRAVLGSTSSHPWIAASHMHSWD